MNNALMYDVQRKKSGSARTRFKSHRGEAEEESAKVSQAKAFGTGRTYPNSGPQPAAFGCRLLLFADRTTSAISIPPPQQIPSKWPLRKLLSALPRRTSPWAPRSARVRHPEHASSATIRDPDNRHPMQKLQKPGPLANNMSLQASSSSALPVSSPPSTTPSSTSPISRTSEQHPSKGLRI